MLVTLGGQTVTCMLLLTSYFCFYFQRWRESVVSTFWDSINPKVIFGTWYQIIKGIFCCSHTFLIRSRWSFPLFLWPHCVIQGWYCEENLDVSHSWGSNGYLHVIAYLLFLFLLPKMKGVRCFHILRFHKPEGHIWYLVPNYQGYILLFPVHLCCLRVKSCCCKTFSQSTQP